jgi:hypothetical protein
MKIQTIEQAQPLANEFLATKERKNYYETKSFCEPYDEYVGMLVKLSDDEVSQIRSLKERYGQDFINHLQEVFDDEDVISDMFYGDPVDIDLDYVHHQYTFTLHEVNGEKVSSRQVLVELSDKEYAKLLAWHLYDGHLVMNTLFYRDENLCRRIMRETMRYVCDDCAPIISNPFVFTMDEAQADAEMIRKAHNSVKEAGYLGLFY